MKQGDDVSLILAGTQEAARSGSVMVHEDDRISGSREKPAGAGPGLINADIYLIRRLLIEAIPSGRPVSFKREFFPQRISHRCFGCYASGPFIDIGTSESYLAVEEFFKG